MCVQMFCDPVWMGVVFVVFVDVKWSFLMVVRSQVDGHGDDCVVWHFLAHLLHNIFYSAPPCWEFQRFLPTACVAARRVVC